MAYGKSNGLSKGAKIGIGAGVAVVVIGIAVAAVMIVKSGVFDKSMRLRLVEGTVNIEDSKGNLSSAGTNKQFESGDIISTSYDGLASVVLDNNKTVNLDGYSRAKFLKQGKQLEINLLKGGLFFEVNQRLEDDETYLVKSTNLTIGINKAASGYIFYDQGGQQSIIITDGVVTVEAVNLKTGQRKSVEVHGGQKVVIFLSDVSTTSRDSVEFVITDVRAKDLPEFPLKIMSKNSQLLKKVCEYTGWAESEVQYYIGKLPGMGS